ncbi:unnamed protein product [Rotaria magnacalcarata]|uniref:G-protein coupled receptors family 1 profile domain-containing protein n=2 Tax=Rotaria magnacalcarata TaxID=392030 RepID=A0A817A5N0_9BILA|nr:unnamed protein product [Rotaria magnacalcarata]CAF1477206.1 unnamed protein product [Rotaria magnacalcarata]CAF2243874.1 unnamed protein product [Rotaria magnacalcarata]CAF4308606.1 unnamed protein product [Rotaria magnacalcarata]
MSGNILNSATQFIRTYNVTRIIDESTSTTTHSLSLIKQITMSTNKIPLPHIDISPAACIAFVILILATVGGNTLVLSALFLDKRLHMPSFYLIANMAIADLLLGLSVLPFSSVLELLNDRWIFGQSFCSAWLALDVVCCTASIIALMGVSIDRYIGVTRPLNYGSIMTTRRSVYLVIVIWAVSILTSVVPLFGLTDREKQSNDFDIAQETYETCKVNKNTFYTIFSSMISFYIPVIILLILYSRVYQEAKKQGEKLENERRRLYQIDYQIASEHLRRKQIQTNGHAIERQNHEQHSVGTKPISSSIPNENGNEITTALLNHVTGAEKKSNFDHSLNLNDETQFKKDYSDPMNNNHNDDTVHSSLSIAHYFTNAHRSISKRLSSTFKRNSQTNSQRIANDHRQTGQMSRNDELLIIKRKLHNLKREKKAFRTLGLILGALLICWLPFFVTLPVVSILKHHGIITAENTENTWFKITFWLGYCNSALNPFVYAFSNRAIRRAFREVIFRRFCCCGLQCWLCRHFCPKKSNQYDRQQSYPNNRDNSYTVGADVLQVAPRRPYSVSHELIRKVSKTPNDIDPPLSTSIRTAGSEEGPVVSFANFVVPTVDEDPSLEDDKPTPPPPPPQEESKSTSIQKSFIDSSSES